MQSKPSTPDKKIIDLSEVLGCTNLGDTAIRVESKEDIPKELHQRLVLYVETPEDGWNSPKPNIGYVHLKHSVLGKPTTIFCLRCAGFWHWMPWNLSHSYLKDYPLYLRAATLQEIDSFRDQITISDEVDHGALYLLDTGRHQRCKDIGQRLSALQQPEKPPEKPQSKL